MTLVLDPRHASAIRRPGEAAYAAEAGCLIGGYVEGNTEVAGQMFSPGYRRTDSARHRYFMHPEHFKRRPGRQQRERASLV